MIAFGYDRAIVERFPTVVAGAVAVSGATNGPASDELMSTYAAEQRAVADRLASVPIAEHDSIAAWRRVFSRFGVKPTQHRVAAEALLRRLQKQGDIPNINALVDIGNLVSIRYGVPVAVFDQREVTGSTTVRFADGSERFTDLGADRPVHPEVGEVVFVDDAGVASARRWCWRQSAQSATAASTTTALYTVEAHHDAGPDDVRGAVGLLVDLLAAHQPAARVEWQLLDAAALSVEFDLD